MTDASEWLLHIEAIKALKARYFRSMDTKEWAALADCFTPDLEADFRDAPGMMVQGRDAYISQLQPILAEATTVHHGHMPEIQRVDEHHATGIWAMDDIVILPGMTLQGWGHYHETYRCTDGAWRIARIRLTRLRLLIDGEPQSLEAADA